MPLWIETLHSFTRPAHIVLGGIVLLLFWMQIFSKKGSARHKTTGRIYYWCGMGVIASGLFGAFYYLWQAYSDGAGAPVKSGPTSAALLLGYVSVLTFAMAERGRLAIRHKARDPGWQRLWPISIACLIIFISIALIGYAVVARPANATLSFIVGPLGIMLAITMIAYQLRRPISPNGWIGEHIDGFLGTGITYHTAFIIFGASNFLNPLLADTSLQEIAWLLPVLPAAIGMPAAIIWKRKVKL